VACLASVTAAQTTTMPSTLRYGSGYMDVPTATVIPHLAVIGTFSGFWVTTDGRYDANGFWSDDDPWDDSFWDGSVTLGLYDRVELGASFQSFNDPNEGGNILGMFGRVALLRPQDQGFGLAVGGRYVTAPDFDDNIEYQPTRLGIPDGRFRTDAAAAPDDEINTKLSVYAVSTATLRGKDISFLPEHDFTFSAGWGNGMFREGEEIAFYSANDSEGFFVGGGIHFALNESTLLHVMGEYSGFDLNFGAQLDFGGVRIGGHWLGANYQNDLDVYRSSKFGVLGSLALCLGDDGFLCKPSLMPREVPDTVQLPAPPPDTVMIDREVAPPLPTGTPTEICLATGQNAQVMVTAQGDTLVGPNRVSVRTLRPGVVFAGVYADGMDWFENDEDIGFEQANYSKSGGEVRLDCADIVRIGEHMGVSLYAMRNADRPYEMIYVPVRPGVWQGYQSGLRRTRG
jgi:hypothetical protein